MAGLATETLGLAIASGALVGLLLATFGGGGSVLAAPLLLYVVGVSDPHVAIGTSAAAVAVIALVSLIGHWRGGRVKWPCAITFAVSGLIGSIAGSSIAKLISGDVLLLGFAIAMAFIALSMLRKPRTEGDAGVHITPAIVLRLAPVGLLVGLAAGFFGIGGGFLIVPGLMLATGMTMANATASSLVSVAIFGGATSANYAVSGMVDLRLALALLAGGALGGFLGLLIAKRLESRARIARTGFAALVLLVAAFVAWQAVAGLSASHPA